MNLQFESRSPLVSGSHPARLLTCSDSAVTKTVRVFVVVEGTNDIKFLKPNSTILHTADSTRSHLARWEQRGELIFVPTGGALLSWWDRLAPLETPEFYLHDCELSPETELCRKVIERVNRRPGCRAVLTKKRSVENYLHPQALLAAGGPAIDIGDFDAVPELVARLRFVVSEPDTTWECLSRRARKRCCYHVKRWLNTRCKTDDAEIIGGPRSGRRRCLLAGVNPRIGPARPLIFLGQWASPFPYSVSEGDDDDTF